MSRVAVYNRLKDVVSSGSAEAVDIMLAREVKQGIHDYMCATELPSDDAAACSSCDALMARPVEREDFYMIDVLLAHGAYLSEDICGPDYAYRRKLPKPLLKLAVEFASLDDVRQLLSLGVDVNAHPRLDLYQGCS